MLLNANRLRFRMPHWCGLSETPYAGVERPFGSILDIAQLVRASAQ